MPAIHLKNSAVRAAAPVVKRPPVVAQKPKPAPVVEVEPETGNCPDFILDMLANMKKPENRVSFSITYTDAETGDTITRTGENRVAKAVARMLMPLNLSAVSITREHDGVTLSVEATEDDDGTDESGEDDTDESGEADDDSGDDAGEADDDASGDDDED